MPLLDLMGGAVLADEPGLGKSFVAAEVGRREAGRGAVIEAVVPASLVEQWRETFRQFHVDAAVMTHAGLVTAQPPPQRRRLMIVDEAHVFRNPRTQRYAALARRSTGARLLLVTATPVCNGPADLESLLRLIVCDDALIGRGVPSIEVAFSSGDRDAIEIIVSTLLVRRDRTVLPPVLAFGDLERRVIWTRSGTDVIEAMIASLRFPLVADNALVRDFLRRRLESSEAAILESLRRQRRFYERSLECLAAGRALPKRDYRRAFAHEEDAAAFQTILFWELFVREGVAVEPSEIHDAMARIDEMSAAVSELPRAKERRLVELCASLSDPVLIFSGWTATARSLADAVGRVRRVAVVSGRERANAAAIDSFRRGAVDVLVSTDVGAEGLNLQRAGMVIHYDLPWNPVRIEQRNGRAHRIGQHRAIVRAIYFLPERHRGRVLQKIVQKNRARRRMLRLAPPAVGSGSLVTIRPRVAAGAAIVAFVRAAGRTLPGVLERRHRAGLEAMLERAARDPAPAARLAELEGWIALERGIVCSGSE